MAVSAAYRAIRGGLLLLGCGILCGCEPGMTLLSERPPLLLEVDDVGPPAVEESTPLVVSGSGFPERATGTLILKGEVFVPGQEPHTASLRLDAHADSRSKVHATLDSGDLVRAVRGGRHGTFVGTATLSFENSAIGSELVGEATDVVLDLYSGLATSENDKGAAQGFSAYLGLTLTPDLRVGSLESGSIAESAGLLLSDQLKELDGVRLDSLADFEPRARAKTSRAIVLRGGERLVEVVIPRPGFDPGLSSLAVQTLLWLSCAVVALLVAVRVPRSFDEVLFHTKVPRMAPETEGSFRHVALAFVIVVLFCSLNWPSSIVARIDLLVLLGMASAFEAMLAFARGGRTLRGGFSLLAALGAVSSRVFQLLPLVVAFLSRASEAGSLSTADVSRLASDAPLGLGFLASPWALVLALLSFSSLLPVSRKAREVENSSSFACALSSLALACKAGVWASLYLWASHGTTKEDALLLALKVSLVTIVVHFAARRLNRYGTRLAKSFHSKKLFSLALLAAGAGALLPRLRWFPLYAEEFGKASLFLVVLFFAAVVAAKFRHLNARGAELDPWV